MIVNNREFLISTERPAPSEGFISNSFSLVVSSKPSFIPVCSPSVEIVAHESGGSIVSEAQKNEASDT